MSRKLRRVLILGFFYAALSPIGHAGAKSNPETPAPAVPENVSQSSSDSGANDEALRFNRHTEAGFDFYKQHRYEEALQEFRAALLIRPQKGLWANICRTYQQMGRNKDALVYCTNYLDFVSQAGPGATQGTEVERFKKIVEELKQTIDEEEQSRIKPRIILVPERGPRPSWRLVLGGSLIAVGVGLLATGIYALSIDGHCVDAPPGPASECVQVYNARPAGIGFTVSGLALATAGTIAMALPGPLQSTEKRLTESPVSWLTAPQTVNRTFLVSTNF